jgi:hypothetical protein
MVPSLSDKELLWLCLTFAGTFLLLGMGIGAFVMWVFQ